MSKDKNKKKRERDQRSEIVEEEDCEGEKRRKLGKNEENVEKKKQHRYWILHVKNWSKISSKPDKVTQSMFSSFRSQNISVVRTGSNHIMETVLITDPKFPHQIRQKIEEKYLVLLSLSSLKRYSEVISEAKKLLEIVGNEGSSYAEMNGFEELRGYIGSYLQTKKKESHEVVRRWVERMLSFFYEDELWEDDGAMFNIFDPRGEPETNGMYQLLELMSTREKGRSLCLKSTTASTSIERYIKKNEKLPSFVAITCERTKKPDSRFIKALAGGRFQNRDGSFHTYDPVVVILLSPDRLILRGISSSEINYFDLRKKGGSSERVDFLDHVELSTGRKVRPNTPQKRKHASKKEKKKTVTSFFELIDSDDDDECSVSSGSSSGDYFESMSSFTQEQSEMKVPEPPKEEGGDVLHPHDIKTIEETVSILQKDPMFFQKINNDIATHEFNVEEFVGDEDEDDDDSEDDSEEEEDDDENDQKASKEKEKEEHDGKASQDESSNNDQEKRKKNKKKKKNKTKKFFSSSDSESSSSSSSEEEGEKEKRKEEEKAPDGFGGLIIRDSAGNVVTDRKAYEDFVDPNPYDEYDHVDHDAAKNQMRDYRAGYDE